MKVKKMEFLQDKSGLKACKWSSLNAPGTENPLSHSLLGFEKFVEYKNFLSEVDKLQKRNLEMARRVRQGVMISQHFVMRDMQEAYRKGYLKI